MIERVFISIDANEIGKKLEGYILGGELEELSDFSKRLSMIIDRMKRDIQLNCGNVYMAGGDNLLADLPENKANSVISFIGDICNSSGLRFSVGIGNVPANAYIALKYAKANGYFCIQYDDSMFRIIREE